MLRVMSISSPTFGRSCPAGLQVMGDHTGRIIPDEGSLRRQLRDGAAYRLDATISARSPCAQQRRRRTAASTRRAHRQRTGSRCEAKPIAA